MQPSMFLALPRQGSANDVMLSASIHIEGALTKALVRDLHLRALQGQATSPEILACLCEALLATYSGTQTFQEILADRNEAVVERDELVAKLDAVEKEKGDLEDERDGLADQLAEARRLTELLGKAIVETP